MTGRHVQKIKRPGLRLREDDDGGADLDTIIEVNRVLVSHGYAPGRDRVPTMGVCWRCSSQSRDQPARS